MITSVPTVPQTERALAQARQRLDACEQQLRQRTQHLEDLMVRSIDVRGTLIIDQMEKSRAKTNSKVSAVVGVTGTCLLAAGHFMTSAALQEIHTSTSTVGTIMLGLSAVGFIACANTYWQATKNARPLEQQVAELDKALAQTQATVEDATQKRESALEELRRATLQRQFVRMGTPAQAEEIRVGTDAVHVGPLRVPRRH